MPKPIQPKTSRIHLNLLYTQGIPQKLHIKFIHWVVSYGRFIVVVVEIVVLACFAYRFKLDADLGDLKDQINTQIPFLESLTEEETNIRQTQDKLTNIKKAYQIAPLWQRSLTAIASEIPTNTKLNTLNLTFDDVKNALVLKTNARTSSTVELTTFLSSLKTNKSLRDINMTNISFDQGEITFAIAGTVAQ